ncbi:MAG: hypothetical protein ACR2M7_02565 [Bdellovibrionales bacterium]
MKESTLLAMKNRVNELTRSEQYLHGKTQELEMVISILIKLIELLPGYDGAKEELQKINEELLKKAEDESEELSE